jgi:hypothetical protein
MKQGLYHSIKFVVASFTVIVMFTACSKDFLNRQPLASVNSSNFFNKSSDLQIFVNGFYSRLTPQYNTQSGTGTVTGGNSNLALDANTDMMIVGNSITSSLYRWGVSSVAPDASSSWTNGYSAIRSDNYFLYFTKSACMAMIKSSKIR